MFSEGRERLMANVRQRYSFPPDSEVELGVGSFPAATSPGSEPLSWSRTIENLLWQFAAVFAIYYGDSRHHLCHVLFFDTRVRRSAEFRFYWVLQVLQSVRRSPPTWQFGFVTSSNVKINGSLSHLPQSRPPP